MKNTARGVGPAVRFALIAILLFNVAAWQDDCPGQDNDDGGYWASFTSEASPFIGETQRPNVQITSVPPSPATDNDPYIYNVTCVALEDGASPVMFLGTDDDCGGMLNDNGDGTGTYTFTPDESQGGTSCMIDIICVDGSGASDLGDWQFESLQVNEVNQDPYWIIAAPPSPVASYTAVGPVTILGFKAAADDDLPNATAGDPGYIECSVRNNNCGYLISAAGSGPGSLSCDLTYDTGTPSASSPSLVDLSCSFELVVTDGYGAEDVLLLYEYDLPRP